MQAKWIEESLREEPYDIEVIEKYLEGKLEKTELEAFEKELIISPELAEQVELCKNAIDELSNEGLRTHLKNIHNDLFMESKNKPRWPYYIGIAASVLLLITLGYLFTNRTVSNETLFTSYFEPYPNLVTTRSNNPTSFGKAMESYSDQSYKNALNAFSKVDENDPVYYEMLFYKGIAYLASNKPTEAIQSFDRLEDNQQFSEQLTWYLAMAHLQLNDIENTRKQLLQIEEKSFKYAEAQELLEQLEQ